MIRAAFATILVAVACSSPPVSAPAPRTPAPAPVARPIPQRARVIESVSGEITRLAITPDGSAVLSTDTFGSARLWPRLDGSIEPRIVELPAARALAIGPEPNGFVVAAIDQAGGLTVARIDRDGATRNRVVLGSDPAFVELAMTTRGLLAVTADHTIMQIAADGTITDRITAGVGESIAALAVNGEHAVVQVETTKARRLRWLTISPGLAWGAWVPTKVDPEGAIAVSPGGKYIAAAIAQNTPDRIAIVIEAATGTAVERQALGFGGRRPRSVEVAFFDDAHLALGDGSANTLSIIIPGHITKFPKPSPTARRRGIVVSSRGQVISANSAQLVISTARGQEFLGYGLPFPSTSPSAVAPNGGLLIGNEATFAVLDPGLRAATFPTFPTPANANLLELRHLDQQRWLVLVAGSSYIGMPYYSSAVVDLATNTSVAAREDTSSHHTLAYDARSKLATLSWGNEPAVFRYDPATAALSSISPIAAAPDENLTVIPLVPALARGHELVIATAQDPVTMRWVRDARKPEVAASTVTVDGRFAAADPAGNVFVWHDREGSTELGLYRDGKRVRGIPFAYGGNVIPDPQGRRAVLVADGKISLINLDGTRVWEVLDPEHADAHWLTDGSLALIGLGGVVRLDLETGTLVAARCGWKFGLSKTEHPSMIDREPVCPGLARPPP